MLVDKTNPKISLDEYKNIEKDSNYKIEYIDGYLVASSNRFMAHNKIVNRINSSIDRYLLDKPCEVFSEQIEVILGENRVKPDVFIVCRENDSFKKIGQSFLTIPKIIFEVVSRSNVSLDTITKMELYSRFGIEEYNLVYQEGLIQQYKLITGNGTKDYYLHKAYNKEDIYKSLVMENLQIELKDIFYNLEF